MEGTVDIVREQVPLVLWVGGIIVTFLAIAVRNAFR